MSWFFQKKCTFLAKIRIKERKMKFNSNGDFSMSQEQNNGFESQVKEVIENVRPMLQRDGGDIELVSIEEDNTVKVRLQGACRGCPGARMTLKMGVERLMKEKVPQVKEVVAVD
jgi:Fe-S cluster biogenesis protein NfuA